MRHLQIWSPFTFPPLSENSWVFQSYPLEQKTRAHSCWLIFIVHNLHFGFSLLSQAWNVEDICQVWRPCDWHLPPPTWLGAISRYFQMCVSFHHLLSSLPSHVQCYGWILEKKKSLRSPRKWSKVITCLKGHFVPYFYARQKQLVMLTLYPIYSFKNYFEHLLHILFWGIVNKTDIITALTYF